MIQQTKKIDLILAMRNEEAVHFTSILLQHRNDLNIVNVSSSAQLQELAPALTPPCRVISFSTFIIIKELLIKKLNGNCYNFHPGPPEYPGYDPIGLTLYEGHQIYKVTLHETWPEIDTGPIIDINFFDIPDSFERDDLMNQAYLASAKQFFNWSPLLANIEEKLSPSIEAYNAKWGSGRSDMNSIKPFYAINEHMSPQEIIRRKRAFGGFCQDSRIK